MKCDRFLGTTISTVFDNCDSFLEITIESPVKLNKWYETIYIDTVYNITSLITATITDFINFISEVTVAVHTVV